MRSFFSFKHNFNFNKNFWQFSFVLSPELATWKLFRVNYFTRNSVYKGDFEVNRFRLTYQKLLSVTVCSSSNCLYIVQRLLDKLKFINYCKKFFCSMNKRRSRDASKSSLDNLIPPSRLCQDVFRELCVFLCQHHFTVSSLNYWISTCTITLRFCLNSHVSQVLIQFTTYRNFQLNYTCVHKLKKFFYHV